MKRKIAKMCSFLILIISISGIQAAENTANKKKLFNKLNELEYKKIPEAEYKITKYAKNNKNYETARQIINSIKELMDDAWDFYNSDQLDQVYALIREMEEKIKKAVKTAESGVPKQKPQKISEEFFGDARDLVISIMGGKPFPEPTPYPPSGSTRLLIPNFSLRSRCYNPRTKTYIFDEAPRVLIYTYNIGGHTYQFIMMEDFSFFFEFLGTQELEARKRDQLLVQMCKADGMGSGVKMDYYIPVTASVDKPIDAQWIFEQIFTGIRTRTIEIGGMGAFNEVAKAFRAKPNLKIVGLDFNTKIYPIVNKLEENLKKINELIEELEPEVLINARKLQEAKKEFVEKRKIKEDTIHLFDLINIENRFIKKLSPRQRKLLKLYLKIIRWLETRNPIKKEKEDFIKLLKGGK